MVRSFRISPISVRPRHAEENAFKRNYFLPHYSCVYPCVRSPSPRAAKPSTAASPDSSCAVPSRARATLRRRFVFCIILRSRVSADQSPWSRLSVPLHLAVASPLTSSSVAQTNRFKAASPALGALLVIKPVFNGTSLPEEFSNEPGPPVDNKASMGKSLPLLTRDNITIPRASRARNRWKRPPPR